MRDEVLQPYEPGPFSDVFYVIYDLAPGVIVLLVLALLALGAWIAWRTLPFFRIVQALKHAPRVAIGSAEEGVVMVTGQAFPGQVTPEGYAPPGHVWRETSRLDTRSVPSLARSGTYSVAPILVRDDSGECLIDPRQTWVLPSQRKGDVDHHFGGDATYRIERLIATGDPVIALGVLGRAKNRPGGGELPRCTLHKSAGGVLVLSGRSETRTLLRAQLRFWPRAGAAFFTALLGLVILKEHVNSYPTDAAFVQELLARPWEGGVLQRLERQP